MSLAWLSAHLLQLETGLIPGASKVLALRLRKLMATLIVLCHCLVIRKTVVALLHVLLLLVL